MRKLASKQSLLVDRFGKALVSTQNYSSGTSRKLNNFNYTSQRYLSGNTSNEYRFLNPSERRLINQFALDLFRSSPVIHSAINKKNEWACATSWKPLYRGSNSKWGEEASRYLINAIYPNCYVGGSNMTFNRLLLSIANQLDVAGDILVVFTKTRDGLPRMALYPSNIVGQREIGKQIVDNGRYKNAQIDDGCIMNSSDLPIAYRVLQDTKEDDFDISVRDAQLLYEPTDLCKRGISIIAPSLLTFLSVDSIAEALNQTVTNESKLGLVVSTETGTGDEYESDDSLMSPDTAATAANASTFQPHIIDLGQVTFVNAKSGEKVESLKTDRPHNNTQDWIRYLSETVVYDLGWALPLISPEKLTGANAKMIESQVQQTIAVRQQTLKRVATTYTAWAIATAMENGDLPKVSDDSWRQWDWSMPSEFVINATDVSDLQGWNAGTKTLQEIAARNAGDWQEVRAQRQREAVDALTRATDINKQFPQLSFERCLDIVGIGTSKNASPVAEQTITTQQYE